MGKFNFFKKKTTDEPLCSNLTDNQDCSLVSEIRLAQKELLETEAKIYKLGNREFDMVEISKFLFSTSLCHLHTKLYNRHFYHRDFTLTVQDMESIQDALGQISDFDKFISEVNTVLNHKQLIADEQNKAAELRAKISKAKETLGIK